MANVQGLEIEVWKDVVGFEQYYEVSDWGYIRTKPRLKKTGTAVLLYKEKIRKLYLRGEYLFIGLTTPAVRHKSYRVHRLVAEAFINNPLNLPQVNHKNGNKTDNRAENLEYVTNQDNVIHAIAVLQHPNKSKLKVEDVREIRAANATTPAQVRTLAARYNVDPSTIRCVITRRNWKHVA